MDRRKRQRAARDRARRMAAIERETSRKMAAVRFALGVFDNFRHGYTFTESVMKAVQDGR